MKLVFCGDCVIQDEKNFQLSKEVIEFIKSHDYGICNFEGAIKTEKSASIIKAGPHVFNCEGAPAALRAAGFNVAALSNNHIMDFGVDAFEHTIQVLGKSDFQVVGAGSSMEEAYKPLILKSNDERVCIVNVAQAEFGVMKRASIKAGYAWINHAKFIETITELKQKYDKVIVFAHCGLENEVLPLPEWKRVYHDIVNITDSPLIAAHPHIVQGYEEYNEMLICYSLGNFYFPKDTKKDDIEWNRSLLVSVDTVSDTYEIYPVSIQNGIIDFDRSATFAKELAERSKKLQNDEYLEQWADEIAEKKWEQFYSAYYTQLINGEKVSTILYYLFKAIKNKWSGKNIKINRETMLLHNLQIETHRWAVERYLYNENASRNEFQTKCKEKQRHHNA